MVTHKYGIPRRRRRREILEDAKLALIFLEKLPDRYLYIRLFLGKHNDLKNKSLHILKSVNGYLLLSTTRQVFQLRSYLTITIHSLTQEV